MYISQLVGSFVYTVGDAFRVLELSGPFEAEEVGRLSIKGENLVVADDLAYVAGTPDGLQVIDVAAQAEPSPAASYSTPYHSFDVDVQGSIVAVADSDHDVSGEGGILFMEYDAEKSSVPTEDPTQLAEGGFEAVYPNPSRDGVSIVYQVERAVPVRLDVYDLLGRRVESIEDGIQPAGKYELTWQAAGVSSGTYVVQLTRGDVTESRTVQVTR